jgi:DNA-binding NtrC family response regulator
MRALFKLCARLAQSNVPVVIEGETGTGKELLAQSIHEAGSRASGPFVLFDCTTVPPNLVESALFGHEKGAFTGAVGSRVGVFEQAHGGTLFLDEIGDLDVALQAKLLRAIERAEVQRVGGTGWARVDVRILCATRRDLQRQIRNGHFRDDLYFRLAVARVSVPSLRDRTSDIAVLVKHFWKEHGGDAEGPPGELLEALESYSWPGNVRELQNAIAHLIALGELADLDTVRHLQGAARSGDWSVEARSGIIAAEADFIDRVIGRDAPYLEAREVIVSEFERRFCEAMLRKHGGNVTKAAAASGIGRRYFYVIRNRTK